jgi:2-hydroxy-3-keto-5-methylthiopentenyl-1-phosphate phosphatase
MRIEFKIFVDFDGTITKKDVGEEVFRHFGPAEDVNRIIKDLLEDKISARQTWISLCNSVKEIDKSALENFIDQIEIDSSFPAFEKYCRENEFQLYVLSDGFDFYINRIFERNNISHLKYFANHLSIVENKLIPSFPYLDENCLSSANCKRNHIIEYSSDDDYTVFIGDGNSDKLTAQYCDFIFAKRDLLKFCEIERISYFPFNDFNDIVNRLETLKTRKRLKKRYQAVLKRREVYLQG